MTREQRTAQRTGAVRRTLAGDVIEVFRPRGLATRRGYMGAAVLLLLVFAAAALFAPAWVGWSDPNSGLFGRAQGSGTPKQ